MSLDDQADADFDEQHASKFVEDLAGKNSSFNWMKDERNKRMFKKIENRIQGAMGTGSYDWVDRRTFDQVFDRLTLMSLYKMMNSGVLDTLDFPIARGKEAHVFHGTDPDGQSVAVKIFHTSNAVFKNLMQYITLLFIGKCYAHVNFKYVRNLAGNSCKFFYIQSTWTHSNKRCV